MRDAADVADELLGQRLGRSRTARASARGSPGVIVADVVRERIARRRADHEEADRRHDDDDDQRLPQPRDERVAAPTQGFGVRESDAVAIDPLVRRDRPVGEVRPPFVRAQSARR